MDKTEEGGKPDLRSVPRIELVSLFMNRYEELDNEARIAFRTEFSRRGLPIPDLGAAPAEAPSKAPARASKEPLDQRTFMSYLLLTYTLTGLVYSWIFLVSRVFNRNGAGDPRHRAIMTVISLVYVAVEALVLMLFQIE